jgi:membrane associated rhomboid family serine protease
VYLLEAFGDGAGTEAAIISLAVVPSELFPLQDLGGANLPSGLSFQVPEWATLITYQFLHGSFLHLLSNMLFLWVFGDNVEDAMGHLKFLAFYLLCGVAGGLAHAAVLPSSQLPLIGASGAVSGVIAAYLMLHPRVNVWVLAFRVLPLRVPAVWVLGFWVVSQFVMAVVAPNDGVAWWAHIGGMAAGAVLILFMRRPGVVLFDRGLPAS